MAATSPYDILNEYKQKFIVALQDSLSKHDKVAKGRLFQSIKADVKVLGQKIRLEISMFDYWKFVDKGVNGTIVKHSSPYSFKKKNIKTEAILKFIASRGIKVDLSDRRKKQIKGLKNKKVKKALKQVSLEKKRKSLAFGLGRSISENGFKATNFATDVFESELIDMLQKDISLAVGRDIKLEITKMIEEAT